MLDLRPHTVISLLVTASVTNPAPVIVNYFPPTKELVMGEAVGSAGKFTVTVGLVMEAYPFKLLCNLTT